MTLWQALKVRFHLASLREVQEYMDRSWKQPAAPTAPLLVGFLVVVGVLGVTFVAAWVIQPGAALVLRATTALMTLPPPSREGKLTPSEKRLLVSRESAWRATLITRTLRPEEVKALQKKHDAWQEEHGDKVYREELKPEAVRIALWEYVQTNLKGQVTAPTDFARALDEERLRNITRRAERSVKPRS